MRDCWQEPYTLRPGFKDIVSMLENIIEDDAVSIFVHVVEMKFKVF